eukprot:2822621-Lingulodinium_polyedra.AAC.1
MCRLGKHAVGCVGSWGGVVGRKALRPGVQTAVVLFGREGQLPGGRPGAWWFAQLAGRNQQCRPGAT